MADNAGRDRARRAARRADRAQAVPAVGALPVAAPQPDAAAYEAQIAALDLRIAELQRMVLAGHQAAPAAVVAVDRPLPAVAAPMAPGPAPEAQAAGVAPQVMLTLRKAITKYSGTVSYDAYRSTFDDLTRYYPALTDQQRFELLSSALQGDTLTLL